MPRKPKVADSEIDLLIAKVKMPKLDLDTQDTETA